MDLHLHGDIFKIIKTGTKDIEVRLNDEKRQKLKIGDKITFINRNNEQEQLTKKIIGLEHYNNFQELVNNYEIERLDLKGYTKEYFLKELERFYTLEDQIKYGVIAIIFK